MQDFERISLFCSALGYKSLEEFADASDIDIKKLYQIKSGESSITEDIALNLVALSDKASFEWLMTGKGEMFKDAGNSVLDRIASIAAMEGISITRLELNIGASKGVLSRALMKGTDIQSKWLTEIVKRYPHYNADWILSGEGEMYKDVLHLDVKQRLIMFLESQGISKAEFGRTIGVSSAYVTSMRKSLDIDKIKAVRANYPKLNIDWLLYGEGEMLNEDAGYLNAAERIEMILDSYDMNVNSFAEQLGFDRAQALYDILSGKSKSITENMATKILSKFPEIRRSWLLSGEGEMLYNGSIVPWSRSVKGRLLQFISYKRLSKNRFEKMCGLSKRYVSNISVSIQPDKVEKICSVFPDLNAGWLLAGEGNMLKTDRKSEDMSTVIDRFTQWMNAVGKNDNQVTVECGLAVGLLSKARKGVSDLGKLTIDRILERYPEINRVWLLTGEGSMIKTSDTLFEDESMAVVSDDYERIVAFYKTVEYGSIRKMAVAAGMNVQNIYDIKSGKCKISKDVALKLIKLNPEISLDWLLTGEGEMYKDFSISEDCQTVKDRLKAFIAYKGISIRAFESSCGLSYGYVGNMRQSIQPDKMKDISRCYPELNAGWLLTGEGSMLKTAQRSSEGIPYYAVDFVALGNIDFSKMTRQPDGYIDYPTTDAALCWVDVSGKSMSPLIDAGDAIAIRKVEDWQANILYGEVYAIVTQQYNTVKRIRESIREGYVRFVSENPAFDAQDIPVSSVVAVYKVLGCLKRIL